MAECALIDGCKFFNDTLHDMPEIIREGYRSHFCRSESAKCARYLVAAACGRENVPATLGPQETERAAAILEANGHDIAEMTA